MSGISKSDIKGVSLFTWFTFGLDFLELIRPVCPEAAASQQLIEEMEVCQNYEQYQPTERRYHKSLGCIALS